MLDRLLIRSYEQEGLLEGAAEDWTEELRQDNRVLGGAAILRELDKDKPVKAIVLFWVEKLHKELSYI